MIKYRYELRPGWLQRSCPGRSQRNGSVGKCLAQKTKGQQTLTWSRTEGRAQAHSTPCSLDILNIGSRNMSPSKMLRRKLCSGQVRMGAAQIKSCIWKTPKGPEKRVQPRSPSKFSTSPLPDYIIAELMLSFGKLLFCGGQLHMSNPGTRTQGGSHKRWDRSVT